MRNSDDSKGLTSFFDVQYTGKWSTSKNLQKRVLTYVHTAELYRDCGVDPEIVTDTVTDIVSRKQNIHAGR